DAEFAFLLGVEHVIVIDSRAGCNTETDILDVHARLLSCADHGWLALPTQPVRRFRFRGFSTGRTTRLPLRGGFVSYRCMPSKSAQNSRVAQAPYGSIHRTC